MSEIVDAARAYRTGLLAQERVMMADMAGRYAGIINQLDSEIQALATTMAQRRAQGLPVNIGYIHRSERYRRLQAQAYDEFVRYEAYAAKNIAGNQALFGRLATDYAARALDIVEPGINAAFDRLSPVSVMVAAGFVADGSPLRALMADAWPHAVGQMSDALVTGVGLGYNPRRIARMMREGLGTGLHRTLVIARTETQRVQRVTSAALWRSTGAVMGFQRVSTHDSRVCPACLFAEGEFFNISEDFAEHPQGRCVMIPVTRRSGPHSWEQGPEWFAKQSESTQRAILGPGRLDLWRQGGFDLRDVPVRVPNSVWGPGMRARGLAELASLPKPRVGVFDAPEIPVPPAMLEDGFPADLDRLETVKGLGGSTGAQLVRDPADGALYVRKMGLNADHLLNEVATDRAYKAMGVNVPDFHLYDTPNGPLKLARFVEGTTLQDLRGNKRAFNAAVKNIRKDFAADALLGNWDVIGMTSDNVLIDKAGKVWRIDNGGGLLYSQGQRKTPEMFNKHVNELWSMRRSVPGLPDSPTAYEVFGDLEYKEIIKQMKALKKHRKAVLGVVQQDAADALAGRFDTMDELTKLFTTLEKDKWNADYADDFSRHLIGVRRAGIKDKLPSKMLNKGTSAFDESGLDWDHLRTPYSGNQTSIMQDVADYINGQGGDYSMISYWARQQAGDSWNNGPKAAKYFLVKQRGETFNDFYWDGGLDSAKRLYEDTIANFGETKMRESWAAWHAFNYDFMQTVDFKNNSIKRGVVKLIRTESDFVMSKHNMVKGDKGIIQRGALESTSIFEPFFYKGRHIVRQEVPHHRVFGVYMMEQTPGAQRGMFAGDHENEIVAMMEGVTSHFERTRR